MQIDRDLNSEHAELFLDVKEFLRVKLEKYVVKITEKYSENITSLFCKQFSSGFCYIKVKDDYIHIGWFNGTKINDKPGLLFGNGKQIRGQKVYDLDERTKNALVYYVEQSYIALLEKEELKKR